MMDGYRLFRSDKQVGDETLESSLLERDLGVWLGGKLNTCQQCVLAAKRSNHVLGCIKHSITSWSRDVIDALYTAVMWPHLRYCVQFWMAQYKKDINRVCPEENNQNGERP